MAEAVLVFVKVHDRRLFVTGGLVQRWHAGIVAQVEANAKLAAPERSGFLAREIFGETSGEGTHFLTGNVVSGAPYSSYVLFGTGSPGKGRAGFIYSTRGWANKALVNRLLSLRSFAPGSRKEDTTGFWMVNHAEGIFHMRVHGQKPNNFLLTGYNRTSRTHRSLRPISPSVIRL